MTPMTPGKSFPKEEIRSSGLVVSQLWASFMLMELYSELNLTP